MRIFFQLDYNSLWARVCKCHNMLDARRLLPMGARALQTEWTSWKGSSRSYQQGIRLLQNQSKPAQEVKIWSWNRSSLPSRCLVMCHYLNLLMWIHLKVLSWFAGQQNFEGLMQYLSSDCKTEEKPHTIEETLKTPCMLEAAQLVLNNANANKLRQISLSNNTMKEHIQDMSQDVMCQVVEKVRVSPFFFIQLDEFTDVAQCPQLLVWFGDDATVYIIMCVQFCIHIYIKYSNIKKIITLQANTRFVSDNHMGEEMLFCKLFTTTTKAGYIMARCSASLRKKNCFGYNW